MFHVAQCPSTLFTKSTLDLFRFVQSTFPCDVALLVEEKRNLWNPFVNFGVATADERRISQNIARHESAKRLFQDYLKEDGPRV